MRMWSVPVGLLCRRHLLGEHLEMHMFAGCIIRGKNIHGYIETGLVEVNNLRARHDELAAEMTARGYRHNSVFPSIALYNAGSVDAVHNLTVLASRCAECRSRIVTAFPNFKKE